MSDTTTIVLALVPCISATIAAIVGMLNSVILRRNTNKLEEQSGHINDSRRTIEQLEKNTNSMKDALVKVVGESEFAKGLKEGIERPK